MIRLVTGFFIVLGSVGGAEFGNFNYFASFLLGTVGLMLMYSPVKDGSIERLAKNDSI